MQVRAVVPSVPGRRSARRGTGSCTRRLPGLLAALALLVLPQYAAARLAAWNLGGCETPSVFYSPAHDPIKPMCCSNVALPSVGVCPGGGLCPADGVCVISTCSPGTFCPKGNPCPADGRCLGSCVALDDPLNDLPNIVLVTSDDQAACQFGFSGTCRTDVMGTPVPAPYTPTLDDLAQKGKVFPVAHNSANWCFPSLDTIITGRLPPQGGCSDPSCAPPGSRNSQEMVGAGAPTIAQLINSAGPGYCSYRAGKGSGVGFDATRTSHNIGRTPCSRCGERSWDTIGPTECPFDPALCPNPDDPNAGPECDGAPRCGEDILTELGKKDRAPSTGDMNTFLDDIVAKGADGKNYLPKKFFAWFVPHLPHTPAAPDGTIERRPHLTGPIDQSYCKDFLFGYQCTSPSPGVVDVLGPRFPFGAPAYAAAMRGGEKKSKMQGSYGNVYWLDNSVGRIREFLAKHVVETAAGPASLASNTVILFLSDNGSYLPRSKKRFTENGFRTGLIVYDPRHETPNGARWKIDDDLAHATDILTTTLSYAGVTPPVETVGHDLREWVESPSPQPMRNAMCGTDIRSLFGTQSRYLLVRGGQVGQCSDPTVTPCTGDGDCNQLAGELCSAAGTCAVPSTKPCIDDTDCRVSPGDDAVCVFQDRMWCSNSPARACTADSDCRANGCKTCSKAPSTTCQSDIDCAGGWGTCEDAPGDQLACTCGRRMVKLYDSHNGFDLRITDLLRDPDETDLVDGDATANATSQLKLGKLAHRLRCCMDEWWLPPVVSAENCPEGCDARASCL